MNINQIWLCCLVLLLSIHPAMPRETGDWQVAVTGGAFALNNDELQNIYGNGFAGMVTLANTMSEHTRLKLGISRFGRSGDPFYRADDFDAGDAATLTVTNLSMSLEGHLPTIGYPRLNAGAGIDYAFAREKIVAQPISRGSNVGAHFSVSPEFRLSHVMLFVLDFSYRFLEVNFKSGRDRYRFDLSGASLLAGIGLTF